jgi:hypothetical protein
MSQIRIATIEEVHHSRAIWNDLVKSMRLPTVFLTWEWITTWLEHFGKLYKPVIIFIYDQSDLKAILPLSQRSMKLRARLLNARVISFCGSIELYPDHLDIICAQDNADAYAKKAMDFLLNTYTKWDVLYLPYLAGDGYFDKYLSLNKNRRTIESGEIIAPFIKVGNDFESLLAGLARKKRYNLMREHNILFDHNISMTRIGNSAELESALDELFLLHKARAGENKITSSFYRDEIINFHRDVSRIFLELGWLGLYFLRENDTGKAISAAYGFVHEKRFNYYQTGLDPAWQRFSPGKILIYKILEDICTAGIAEFDFLGGNDSYKTYWTKDHRFMRTYSIFNRNITGTLEYYANKLVNSIKSVLQTFHKGGQSS